MFKKTVHTILLSACLVALLTACNAKSPTTSTTISPKDNSTLSEISESEDSSSKEIPIENYEDVDYQDLVGNNEQNVGRYVRIRGQISKSEYGSRYLPDKIFQDKTAIGFNIEQFNEDVSDILNEGEYVVIRGQIAKSSHDDYFLLKECYLELYGEKAKLLVEPDQELWNEKRETIAKDYRNSAKKYSYDEVARYPEKHKYEVATFSGSILQVDDDWLLLMSNDSVSELIYVLYDVEKTGRLLEDDYINVYGDLRGVRKYTTVLGSEKEVPQINAEYIVR